MRTQKGRIVKGLGGLYEVFCEDKTTITCRGRGIFRHDNNTLTVGDVVTVEFDEKSNPVISAVDERKNLLIRPPLSNLDVIFCVVPAKDPLPDIFTLDKLISIAETSKIEPVIVFTKSDLDSEYSQSLCDVYSGAGFKTFITSLDCRIGIPELSEYIFGECRDKISAFAGVSGAGKSSLMNMLFPELKITTGSVSEKISRGKHTTRHVELFELSKFTSADINGFLADTPGFSMLDFERFDFFDKQELPYTFREFEKYIGKCKYKGCTHLCEDGCAIVSAVHNGEIAKTRHDSYVTLYNILKQKPTYGKNK